MAHVLSRQAVQSAFMQQRRSLQKHHSHLLLVPINCAYRCLLKDTFKYLFDPVTDVISSTLSEELHRLGQVFQRTCAGCRFF